MAPLYILLRVVASEVGSGNKRMWRRVGRGEKVLRERERGPFPRQFPEGEEYKGKE